MAKLKVQKQLSLYRFRIPLLHPLLFKGQTLTDRQGLWLVNQEANAQYALGEISPLPGFSDESLTRCEQQLLTVLNTDKDLFQQNDLLPSVQWAVFCLQHQVPFEHQLTTLHSVPLLLGEPEHLLQRYQTMNSPNLLKIKVARHPIDDEIDILKKLVCMNPNIRLRLDANQQWSAEQYRYFLQHVDAQYIDYIEEPTASLSDNLSISEDFNVSIALDESLLHLTNMPIHSAISALIIKPTLIGNPNKIAELLTHAKQQHLTVSISSCYESPFALKQLHASALQWQQTYDIPISLGLDTANAFKQKITASSTAFIAALNKAEKLWPLQ